jgi:hypothetical protein
VDLGGCGEGVQLGVDGFVLREAVERAWWAETQHPPGLEES